MVCCHLINENQEFEDLVRSASNLSEEEKEKYIGKLYHDCGISSSDLDQYRYDDTEQQELIINEEEGNMHPGSDGQEQENSLQVSSFLGTNGQAQEGVLHMSFNIMTGYQEPSCAMTKSW